jgi:hypothetical protein
LEDAETHKKEQVLVPADIESVVAGEGTVNDPADGPKELFYRWEQGETGWLWARGQWFFDEKLAFQLRDNTKPDKSFDEFRKALPPGKSVPASFTSPKWEGKVRAKDERDPDKPKTVAILPIVDAGMVIGLLRIVRPTDTGLFDEDEVSLLYAVAAHVATVIRVTNAADYGAKASLQPVMWQMHEMMREIRTFIEAARKPSKGNANLENKLGIIDKHYAWFRAVKAAGDLLTGQEQISSIEQLPKRLERFGLIGSPVEIGDLLNEAKDRSVRVIDTERTKVKLHLPKNGWPAVTVYGEREALLTVFTETIRNAIEHKRDEYGDQSSKVAIGIEADVVSDPDFVKIVIRDDAPMLHDAIVIGLQEIQRQPEGAQLPCRGWGLISNTLVLMIHGGSIAVRPTPGTKYEKQFEITLPIHRA